MKLVGMYATTLMKPIRAENAVRRSVGSSHVFNQEIKVSTSKKGSSSRSAAKPASKSAGKSVAKTSFPAAPAISSNQTTQAASVHLIGNVKPENVDKLVAAGIPVRHVGDEYVITEDQRQGERRQEERRRQEAAAEAAGVAFQPATMTTAAAPSAPAAPTAAPTTAAPATGPFVQEGTPAAAAAANAPAQPAAAQPQNRRSSDRTLPVVHQVPAGTMAPLAASAPAATPGHAGTDGQKADWKVERDQQQGGQPQVGQPQLSPEYQAQLAALQRQYGIAPGSIPSFGGQPVTTPRSGREQRNNITRPGPDTRTGTIWRCADEISQAQGSWASINQLKSHPDLRNTNDHTIRTQYARWRTFNGISGRQQGAQNGQQMQPQGQQAPQMQPQQQPQAAPMAAVPQASQPQQMTPAPTGPMTDEDYNMYTQMLNRNLLPAHFKAALDAETLRRFHLKQGGQQ